MRLSRIVTLAPSFTSARARFDPIKPKPPVINTRFPLNAFTKDWPDFITRENGPALRIDKRTVEPAPVKNPATDPHLPRDRAQSVPKLPPGDISNRSPQSY